MFLSSLSKNLVNGLKSTLNPAAFRLYSSGGGSNIVYKPPKELGSRGGFGKQQINCCNPQRMAKERCNFKTARQPDALKDLKLERRINPNSNIWEYPAECCGSPCPELLPRFDSLYYKPTDKAKRQYQQTWVECKPLQRPARRVCFNGPTELPPISRRKKSEYPKNACEFDSRKMAALCSIRSGDKCPTTTSPCCRRARYPPSCNFTKPYGICKKKCCPYPSYSECCHPCVPPLKATECSCNKVRNNCDAYEFLRRKLIYKIPPLLPAWPPRMEGSY